MKSATADWTKIGVIENTSNAFPAEGMSTCGRERVEHEGVANLTVQLASCNFFQMVQHGNIEMLIAVGSG